MTGEITYKRTGGRIIELFQPFTHNGVKVAAINLSPVRFGDTLSWRDGEYKSMLALMSKMSGLAEDCLREMRYPDADRVMAIFVDMLPPEIRETLGQQLQEMAQRPPSPPQSANGGAEFPPELYPQQPPAEQDPVGLGVDLNG